MYKFFKGDLRNYGLLRSCDTVLDLKQWKEQKRQKRAGWKEGRRMRGVSGTKGESRKNSDPLDVRT